MCPLQITNDIEHLSSTFHGVNVTFIRHPYNVVNYSNGHKSEMNQQKKTKKTIGVMYFYTSVRIFDSKFQIPIPTKISEFFRHLDNRHLTAHQTAKRQYGQKSKIG